MPRIILEKRAHTGHGAMKQLDDGYFLVAYDAKLSKKPLPSHELAAIVFLRDEHLALWSNRANVTLQELIDAGSLLEEAEDWTVPRTATMVPHGTALYLVRVSS